MRVTTASVEADRGRSNEDFVGAVPGAAVVVDGAFLPGAEGVCRHAVAWYAHRLGGTLLGVLGHGGDRSLAALLASAIERVSDEHRPTCDTAHPLSPWAAVAAVRVRGGRVEHLVLGDATVLLERVGGPPLVVTDRREVVISESYLPALTAARDEEETVERLHRRGGDPPGRSGGRAPHGGRPPGIRRRRGRGAPAAAVRGGRARRRR